MRDVFIAIVRGSLDSAGFDAATVERLLQHRFDLQRAGFRLAYPTATSEAIVVDGEIVGRLITDNAAERVALVDIMIEPDHQGQGIGSQVVADVVDRAGSRPLELTVDHGSSAEAWCRRHGFEQVASDDMHAHLVRVPATSAMLSTGS